jgi:6,7-dimethyl-8-ribityllumazine synthase
MTLFSSMRALRFMFLHVLLTLVIIVNVSLSFTTKFARNPFYSAIKSSRISSMNANQQEAQTLDGSTVRIGIIMTRTNADIVNDLYNGVNASLSECGVQNANIFATHVPELLDVPVTANFLTASKRVDAVICLGAMIKSDSNDDIQYIAGAIASGIIQVSLQHYVPCINGILTAATTTEAMTRSHSAGVNWGKSAVEMGLARMSSLGLNQGHEAGIKMGEKVSFMNLNNKNKNTNIDDYPSGPGPAPGSEHSPLEAGGNNCGSGSSGDDKRKVNKIGF